MKLLKTCPILLGIATITIALSVVSYAFEDTTYAQYQQEYDPAKLPHFVLVLKGFAEGIYPFSSSGITSDAPDEDFDGDGLANESDIAGEKEVAGYDELNGNAPVMISSNNAEDSSVSGNDSEESISDNDADRTYEFQPVDEDYFVDALFIGDSRTVGLSEYCEPLDTRATFYAKVSLTIYGVLDKPFVKKGDDKITIEQALTENQFGKIYIMLGLNEIGTGTPETFAEEYGNVVNRIRELQPDAIIYIQGIMHVTENKSKGDKHFNNDNINTRNEALSQLADNQTVFYMDMNEAVDDENGNLIKELSFDDVHLKASSYERWYQFLLGHGIIKD